MNLSELAQYIADEKKAEQILREIYGTLHVLTLKPIHLFHDNNHVGVCICRTEIDFY